MQRPSSGWSGSFAVLQPFEHGDQLVGDDRVVERADVLPAHDALGVDEEGFRCTVDAPVDRRAAVAVGQHQHVGIAELLQPAQRVFGFVLEVVRSEEHTSELQSLMRISYAGFCLKKKKQAQQIKKQSKD